MIHHKVQQNTEEWMELRRGKFTASTFKDLFAKETTAAYQKAIYRVAFEIATGEQPESFSNEYMERGHELEPAAIECYRMETFNDVEPGGFFEFNEYIGASPDGLIGSDGILEVKCPAYNTMIEYIIKQKLPSQYKWQVHGQLFVTGRKWCDFIAYHPKLKPVIIRIERDDDLMNELDQKLNESIEKVQTILKLIK
jgi:putative phage-type endonuclease